MPIAKFIVMLATAVVSAVAAAVTDGKITPVEWVNVAIAGVTAISVYLVPNLPAGSGIATYTKAAVVVLMAVLTALTDAIVGGLQTSEMLQIVIVALGAIGTYFWPNSPAPATARA